MSLFVVFLLVLGAGVTVNCETHSLTYVYTALSRDPHIPGIHEFTAMGILDTRVIDYFDSKTQVKTPKTSWMKDRLDPEYWEKGTRSRKSKQQWFKVNLDILKERMNQSDHDIHVLQWRHGCVGEAQPDGSLKYSQGLDMYSYNGDDFLSFDHSSTSWVAPVKAAEPTKRKWDEVQVLKDYTKGYLEKECMEWLKKFMAYGKREMYSANPPDVYLFANNAKSKMNVVLNCMATSFYPPEIKLLIKRNDQLLTEDDGVMSTGTRPNEDNTFQRRDSVEILRSDVANYSCHVIHHPTGVDIVKFWNHALPDHVNHEPDSTGTNPAGIAVGILAAVGLAFGVLMLLRYKGLINLNIRRDPKPSTYEVIQSNPKPFPPQAPIAAVVDVENERTHLNSDDTTNGGSKDSLHSGESGIDEKTPLNSDDTTNGGSKDSLHSGESGIVPSGASSSSGSEHGSDTSLQQNPVV